MVSVGLDGYHLEWFDIATFNIWRTVCHMAKYYKRIQLEMEYRQFFANRTSELHRFCIHKNAGDV
jgi:hypothetical protein